MAQVQLEPGISSGSQMAADAVLASVNRHAAGSPAIPGLGAKRRRGSNHNCGTGVARCGLPSLYYGRTATALENYPFDANYVRLLAEGDASVAEHFSAYFGKLLLLKLRSRVRSAAAIDDIRQETFLRVLRTLREKGGLQHPERLGAFVNSVCNNVLFESFRAQARYAPLPEDEGEPEDKACNLHQELINEERKQAVENVLERLAPVDRDILKMLFYEDADKQEICRVMGVDRNYLRVLLFRARLHFKAALRKVEAAIP